MRIFLFILLGFATMVGTMMYFVNNRPTKPEPVAIETIRCDFIAPEGLTVAESKRAYGELCGESHPVYNCRAVEIKNGAEFRWECWGFRKDLEPKSQHAHDKHPSAEL